MIARLTEDGAVLEVSAAELRLISAAVADYAASHQHHAMLREDEADMRRGLAEEYPRGRRANIRVAGELDAEAANHRRAAEGAIDLLRVLANPATDGAPSIHRRVCGQIGESP